MSIVTGTVCSGRGKATYCLAPVAAQIERQLGAPAVPGSLNVLLDRLVTLDPAQHLMRTKSIGAFWPVKLNRSDALAFRWLRCPLHVVEIISPLPLRKHFGLRDGDAVEIDFGPAIAPTFLVPRICWWLLWWGREPLVYSSDTYALRTRRHLRLMASRAGQRLAPPSPAGRAGAEAVIPSQCGT